MALEANPSEIEPLQIEEIDVLLPMVDGNIVHQTEATPDDVYHQHQPRVSTGANRPPSCQ